MALAAGAGWVVINVGGLGFRVETPTRNGAAHVGQTVSLFTNLVVREDSLTLFGFETEQELEVFGILLGVSGVGPRSALGVLSVLSPAEIARAATMEDEKPFKKVSGIGPKTAKLITVQLAGKLKHLSFATLDERPISAEEGPSDEARIAATVEEGLLGLGYSEGQAGQAVEDAISAGASMNEGALLRAALMLLQNTRVGGRATGMNGTR